MRPRTDHSRRFRLAAAAILVALATFFTGTDPVLAQCNGVGCDSILVQTTPEICQPALITRFICNDGTQVAPQFSPYPVHTTTYEPCPCSSGLSGVRVGSTILPIPSLQQVQVSPDCCLQYDIIIFQGCVQIKISPCP